MKIELPLDDAQFIAGELVAAMEPYCDRIAIAGSIRRKKPVCGDIEVVCIPKREYNRDLFGNPTNLLRNELFWQPDWQANIRWIKPGVSDVIPWHIKPDGKYWRGLIAGKVPLDIFLVQHDNWGIQYLIRTGPKEFSEKIVTALRYGKALPVSDGFVRTRTGEPIPTPEEADVFDLLKMAYIDPEDRA